MVEILKNWLKSGDRGIEWGSGRSTIWFAERVGSLVSVEHNPDWYMRVSAEISRKGLNNVDYNLCEDENSYSSFADRFPPESFDFCLVDGVARDRCALAALSLVKSGGIVVVDNYNYYLPTGSSSPHSRKAGEGAYTAEWTDFWKQVEDWRHVWTTNGVFDTALWVKPSGIRETNQSIDRSEQYSSRLQS
jgi:predicted O-methyltransferase YrrM